MSTSADIVATCVLSTFDALPSKFKPRIYPNGTREWVPLSGIVLSKGDGPDFKCVSLGTGMRCLPASKVHLAKGLTLHDWHAEVVAIRAFNFFLLEECRRILQNDPGSSSYVRLRHDEDISADIPQPFCIEKDIRIHMYSSVAPCGDASMELIMDAQIDATPWEECQADRVENIPELYGRGFFSKLGIVRRKPGRRDAPDTLSKSCSDKLAMKQCTSLLSSITNLLVLPENAYLHDLVHPQDQYLPIAAERAYGPSGRMSPLIGHDTKLRTWAGGFSYEPFSVHTTTKEFSFCRTRALVGDSKPVGSNITAMWTPHKQEVLIGGVRQGFKQFTSRGSSAISKAGLWGLALAVSQLLKRPTPLAGLGCKSYKDIKQSDMLKARRQVKDDVRGEALTGWIRNDGDADFCLED